LSDDHVRLNRGSWDEDAVNWVERGREAWQLEAPVWGRGNPESELHLLPDIAGLDAIELGCGTAYVSAWLMRLGARVIGLDNSSRQLATARSEVPALVGEPLDGLLSTCVGVPEYRAAAGGPPGSPTTIRGVTPRLSDQDPPPRPTAEPTRRPSGRTP
jgi:SAM-dependent methyltransferase